MQSRAIYTGGFTLVELLLVMAIIGMLAAIVLASLGSARSKANDASIIGSVDSIHAEAEMYAASNGNNYDPTNTTATAAAGSSCGSAGMWSDPTIAQATKAVSLNAGVATLNGVSGVSVLCKSNNAIWFVAAVLKTNSALAWCADSFGRSATTSVANITSAAQVSSMTFCP